MGDVPIPEGLVGRPGMVAMLKRLGPAYDGRLVTIRHAVGPMTSLGTSPKPVFAWQVLVLGEPIDVHGKLSQDIVVADLCLRPVSQITTEEVEKLKLAQAHEDFDAAMADLRHILERNPMTDEELEAAVNEAENMFGIGHALEVVPVATVLRELGFKPSRPDSDDVLDWSGMHLGQELYVFAGPDMFGRWMITGSRTSERKMMRAEQMVLENEPRGKLTKLVVDLWRQAFGIVAPVPSNLELGLIYEQHRRDVRSLDIGLPRLYLDGEVFRAIRKWLAQRCPQDSRHAGPQLAQKLSLSFSDGLLRLRTGSELFACPGKGIWIEDCEVSLDAFIDIPPSCLRGPRMVLERQMEKISMNGYTLALLTSDAEAT